MMMHPWQLMSRKTLSMTVVTADWGLTMHVGANKRP